MSPTAKLEAFAQSIHLVTKNRYFDDITGEDGLVFTSQVIDWTNMYLDELENTLDTSGQLVDWWFNRSNAYALGTATEGEASVITPTAVDHLMADELRYVQISQDGLVISNWAVVQPKDITNKNDRIVQDMCAIVGANIVFSRAFRDTENNGEITGDVALKLPRLTRTNVKVLDQVRPNLLLKLGVAKNATLPDIVQGGLSPSFAQKYDTLLTGAIARSVASSIAATAARDNYSGIGGVGF